MVEEFIRIEDDFFISIEWIRIEVIAIQRIRIELIVLQRIRIEFNEL